MISRTRRIAVVALTNTLTVAVVLSAIEVFVRISCPQIQKLGTESRLAIDPYYGTSAALRPRTSGLSDGKLFATDQYGFWKYGSEPDTSKPGWLLIGDSVTMGIGVDPDSTFGGRLAASVRSMAVLNSAWIGYTSADYLNIVGGILRRTKRDIPFRIRRVTLFWCLNDVYSRLDAGGDPGQGVREIGGGVLSFLRSNRRAYQWLKATLTDRPRTYFFHDLPYYSPASNHFTSSLRDLDSIALLCCLDSIAFEVVLLPYEYQLRERERRPQQIMTDSLSARGVRWIDLGEVKTFSQGESSRLFRYGDGIHFGAEGHRLVYEAIRATYRGELY